MTDNDIDAIRQRADRYKQTGAGSGKTIQAIQLANTDVPALLAKVDELTAEVRSVTYQLTETVNDLTQSRAQAATYANEIGSLTAENARVRQQRDELAELEPIVKAAEYKYGDLFCINGDCDHAAEVDDDAAEDAPCPLVETRYATGAEIVAITPLLMSTDGDALDDAEEIPVGEIRRVLGEARAEATR